MRITVEISDDVLKKARSLASRRGLTLQALVEVAVRNELSRINRPGDDSDFMEIGPHGVPRLKRRARCKITSEMIYKMMEEDGI